MENNIKKIVKEIADDIVNAARQIMSSDVGVNEKVGFNTLHGSRLYTSVKANFSDGGDNIVIDTFFNHYIDFIEWDRPKKYGKRPPIDAIIKWLKRKHICSTTDNIKSVAYAVSYAIWRDGHKGRKILETLDKYVDNGFENIYADKLFETLFDEVEKILQ